MPRTPKRSEVLSLMHHFNQTSYCSGVGGGRLMGCSNPAHSHHHSCNKHRPYTQAAPRMDNCFEFKSSNLRFGRGVTSEVGMDVVNFGANKVCVMTDQFMADLPPMKSTVESLNRAGVDFEVYDNVRVEPTDGSFQAAAQFAKDHGPFDAFIAVGGGSVMDTCKAANLFATHPDYDFYDFVNAPIGKGLPIPGPLKPLIAIPTTTGTGSETTGIAVFDIEHLHAKTGIGSRLLTPTLALIDSQHTIYQSSGLVASSGFDVLCHALESYTAIDFDKRGPAPGNPKFRPAYQGANPISDVWCEIALPIIAKYFERAVASADDFEAREQMQYASCFAGMGFGTAGCHLPHGMSYPISGLSAAASSDDSGNSDESVRKINKKFFGFGGYEHIKHSLIPHGVSVVMSAPSVFEFTSSVKVSKHKRAFDLLRPDSFKDSDSTMLTDAEVSSESDQADYIGKQMRDLLVHYMAQMNVPLGLKHLGFDSSDIDTLVKGTMPQQRVLQVAPTKADPELVAQLFENSLSYD